MPGWDETFRWLKITGNRAAGEILVRAMEVSSSEIRRAAASALMGRTESKGHQIILDRVDPASEEWRGQFDSLPIPFLDHLRTVLIRGEPAEGEKACHFLLATEQFEFVPFLANVLEHRECEPRSVVIHTIVELCRRLKQHMETSNDDSQVNRYWRVAEQLRRALLVAADRFPKHECREVLEAYLVLAEGRSGSLAGIVNNRWHPARRALLDIFLGETSPDVLAVICNFLYQPEITDDLVSIISRRSDLPFIRHFLGAVGLQPNPVVERNLRRFHNFRWLKDIPQLLPQLDEMEQQAIPVIVTRSRVPRNEALKVIGQVLLEGLPAGRRSAAEALAGFHGTEANALAIRAMQDQDPSVQAAIIPQLRHRGIFGALPYIVSKLDSPYPLVRRAARKTLREFKFTRFLQVWDLLAPDVRKNTGMLVKRVDPRAALLLRSELLSPFRLRRLRALEVAIELDLVSRLESSIVSLLEDEDSAVRAQAARALVESNSAESYRALLEASNDASALVRSAVSQSLEERRRRMELPKQSQQQSASEDSGGKILGLPPGASPSASGHDYGQDLSSQLSPSR
ncbi:MAG: HEAT repeat domain-containing protein [Thermogutta sp.]